MRLKEFIDKNGNKVTIPKNTPSVKSNVPSLGSFKERFEKLLEYTSKHKNPSTKNITTENLTDDTLEFTEHYYDGSSVSYEIYIGPLTEAWSFKVYTDGDFRHPIDHMSGMEWSELLKELRYYIVIPVVGTPEYKNILKEFLDKNGNKVSISNNTSSNSSTAAKTTKTNKDKFEELIKYMDANKVPYVTKTEILRLNDISLLYKIYRKSPKAGEYTITLELHYSRFLDDWQSTIYKNDINIDDFTGKGWEELLKALRASEFGTYALFPKPGSKEHDSLCEAAELKEFVDKNGNRVNLPKASSNAPKVSNTSTKRTADDFTDRFTKLCNHLPNALACNVKIVYLEPQRVRCRVLDKNDNFLFSISIDYLPETKRFKVSVFANDEIKANNIYMKDWDYLLDQLLSAGIIKDKSLCESASIADDFKTYENLWD